MRKRRRWFNQTIPP